MYAEDNANNGAPFQVVPFANNVVDSLLPAQSRGQQAYEYAMMIPDLMDKLRERDAQYMFMGNALYQATNDEFNKVWSAVESKEMQAHQAVNQLFVACKSEFESQEAKFKLSEENQQRLANLLATARTECNFAAEAAGTTAAEVVKMATSFNTVLGRLTDLRDRLTAAEEKSGGLSTTMEQTLASCTQMYTQAAEAYNTQLEAFKKKAKHDVSKFTKIEQSATALESFARESTVRLASIESELTKARSSYAALKAAVDSQGDKEEWLQPLIASERTMRARLDTLENERTGLARATSVSRSMESQAERIQRLEAQGTQSAFAIGECKSDIQHCVKAIKRLEEKSVATGGKMVESSPEPRRSPFDAVPCPHTEEIQMLRRKCEGYEDTLADLISRVKRFEFYIPQLQQMPSAAQLQHSVSVGREHSNVPSVPIFGPDAISFRHVRHMIRSKDEMPSNGNSLPKTAFMCSHEYSTQFPVTCTYHLVLKTMPSYSFNVADFEKYDRTLQRLAELVTRLRDGEVNFLAMWKTQLQSLAFTVKNSPDKGSKDRYPSSLECDTTVDEWKSGEPHKQMRSLEMFLFIQEICTRQDLERLYLARNGPPLSAKDVTAAQSSAGFVDASGNLVKLCNF